MLLRPAWWLIVVGVKGTVGVMERWRGRIKQGQENRRKNEEKGNTQVDVIGGKGKWEGNLGRRVFMLLMAGFIWSCQKRVFGFLMILVQLKADRCNLVSLDGENAPRKKQHARDAR